MQERQVFLTGASGEIGQAIAQRLRQQHDTVIAPTRQEMDLEQDASIEGFLTTIQPNIDIVIHCAGFNEPKPIVAISPHDLHKTMQINALSFYSIMNFLLKKNKINANGSILAISSIYGFLVRKGRFSYSASKQSLQGMVKTLALELGHLNIKANLLSPGFVDTKMTRKNNNEKTIEGFKQKIPLGRLATTEDIAEVACFMCSPANRFITGQEIVIDGGYSIGGFEQ